MSEDGFSDSFEEPNIEIQIKTLLGTTFHIKVSPNETVSDIKKKIYRVEGIPVYQQNLIFQSLELKDTTRLCDSGIRNGSTLTLVSAMRGGPISTRRLSVSCEHYLLKELKDLLENTREEMTPGSKVSVLVFKEGDIINLLRVIENEDGSYSPYSEGPISPPSKPSRRDTLEAFERLVEDTEMCTKIATLRKKMEELNIKKQTRSKQPDESSQSKVDYKNSVFDDEAKGKHNFSYRFLEECAGQLLDNVDLTIFEKSLDEGNQSESEEIALKDKHRTKPKGLQSLPIPKPNAKSLYSERKGTYSHTRQNYAKIAKRREPRLFEKAEKCPGGYTSYSRDRTIGTTSDTQKSSLLDNNSSYSNTLPSLSALDDRLGSSCILPSSNLLENDGVDRLALPNDSSENPYLLEGLNSNKLPDLRILDTDDFLTGTLDDTGGMLGNAIGDNPRIDSGTFLNLPMSNNLESNSVPMARKSRVLPEITSRINNRRLGPLTPHIASNNTIGARVSNSATLMNPLSLTSSMGKLSHTRSLESSTFPNLELTASYSNKLPQTSYSLASTNKLSQSSNTLDTPLPNLTRLETLGNLSSSRSESPILGTTGGTSVEEMGAKLAEQLHLLDEEPNTDVYGESLSVSTRNRVHLTRLVLASEGAERPKSSPDSIELEEHAQDVWEIHHEPASERLKHSATCKVGLLKRRQGMEYNYDSLENSQPNLKPELGNLGNYSKSSTEFGVCSGANFYMPQYLSTPSAIPPQYAPKHHPKYCDLFFRNEPRSPLYSRRNRKENLEIKEEKFSRSSANFEGDCSSIQRLKNDENIFGPKEEFNEDLFGYYNLGCAAADLLERVEEKREVIKLAPVIKKKSRCNECNKRLNITNIYNCRCGRIFCSQHRYSEFQQDGATAHTSADSIDLLTVFDDRVISRFGPDNWLPRSYDLMPPNYFLWGYIKSLVYVDKPNTLDASSSETEVAVCPKLNSDNNVKNLSSI